MGNVCLRARHMMQVSYLCPSVAADPILPVILPPDLLCHLLYFGALQAGLQSLRSHTWSRYQSLVA